MWQIQYLCFLADLLAVVNRHQYLFSFWCSRSGVGRSWYSWWCVYLLYTDFSPENCSSCSKEIGILVACKLECIFLTLSLAVPYNENSFPSLFLVSLSVIYFPSTPYAYLAKCFLIFLNYQTMPFNSGLCHWHSVITYLLDCILRNLALLQLFLIGERGKKKLLVSLNLIQFYSQSATAATERLEFVLKKLQFSFLLLSSWLLWIFFQSELLEENKW